MHNEVLVTCKKLTALLITRDRQYAANTSDCDIVCDIEFQDIT
jgi:hypothetical protein